MNVLIKGMEMPTTPLLVCIYPNGICSDEEGKTYRAVPVPPHGDLIDRDAMEREVCGGCVHGEHKYSNCIDCALANAPTIIPAEEGE